MRLSKLQEEIINAPYNKVVVMASAAAGKTSVLTEKTRQVLKSGVDPRQVAVITFTNMAAAELKQRLGEDYKDGAYIGTIHGLANYMLRVGGVDTSKILDEEDFDKLFDLITKNPVCVRHLDWILLDEAQDSDKLQFEFLFEMIDPDNFFVVGDDKQAIYSWRGGDADLIRELGMRDDVCVYSLNENYRNGYNILNFAKQLIKSNGMIDDSKSMATYQGAVAQIGFNKDFLIKKIQEIDQYCDWAVLCRTNSEVDQMCYLLKINDIPCETFKIKDLTKAELIKKMKKDTVKVLTVHSAKGLEWKDVAVVGMRYYSREEKRICYVAATRAKEFLIWFTQPRNKGQKRF